MLSMQRLLEIESLNSLGVDSAGGNTDAEANASKNRNGFKKKVGILLFLMALMAIVLPTLVSAQAVSGVTGVVTDSTGAIVPGVDVTLTDTKTARELTTKTNDQGVYNFQNVAPGQGYKLTFTVKGFQTTTLSDVTLGVAK